MASVIGVEPSGFSTKRAMTDRSRPSPDRPSSPAPSGAATTVGSLASIIEGEIIPRMLATHMVGDRADPEPAPPPAAAVSPGDVEAFAPLALTLEADALIGLAERMLRRGVPVDALLIDLLAPSARRLGEFWEEDRCDFVDVTMALWRLQEVVRHLVGAGEGGRRAGGRRALFATMPGDQHSFGTVVVDEIFRREGWETLRIGDAEPMELIGRVAGDWFDLVGLTVTCDRHLARLRSLIAAMRNVSRNPRACVMVGGRIFVDNPGLAVNVGADGTARDARVAAAVAAGLVEARESESIGRG